MDLKARLARLDRLTRKPGEPPPPAPAPAPATRAVVPPHAQLEQGLGLAARATALGQAWTLRHLEERLAPPRLPWPQLDGLLPAGLPASLRPQDILFLDTETTGLAGGTGSLAFLVGLGWWDEGGFVTEQIFLPGPECEGPLLQAVAELAAGFRVVVTYNGGSFDLPLLRTRTLLARRDDPLAHLVSWDLLTAVRRLWGQRLVDCRQQTAENEICGIVRGAGDIDGVLIPHAYFHYLREGDLGLLPAVLRHNRRDVRGMAQLLGEVLAAAADTDRVVTDRDTWPGSWHDAWAHGRICERRGDHAAAGAWMQRAVDDAGIGVLAPGHLDLPLRFVLDAVRLLKRIADWARVERLLDAALVHHPLERRLHREAAILYEHRLVSLDRALYHAERLGDPSRLARLRARQS